MIKILVHELLSPSLINSGPTMFVSDVTVILALTSAFSSANWASGLISVYYSD